MLITLAQAATMLLALLAGCSSFDVAVWVEYGNARVKAPINEPLNPEAHAWIT